MSDIVYIHRFSHRVVCRQIIVVSFEVYITRIGLFSLRLANESNYSSDYACNGTYLAFLNKSPRLFLSDTVDTILVCFVVVTSILLA